MGTSATHDSDSSDTSLFDTLESSDVKDDINEESDCFDSDVTSSIANIPEMLSPIETGSTCSGSTHLDR